ncbi:MAG: diaminopimelate epimerase [Actinomycetota bacterium]|nr:diaminopimelate epimerase [Actinomycetota bacterium]
MKLHKYQANGNDFLILLDLDGDTPVDADTARAVCDRHRGVGADGFIRVTTGLKMELFNADGGRAETSGNGVRCVARALVDTGLEPGPDLVITSDAGEHHATLVPDGGVRVDMGSAKVDDLTCNPGAWTAFVETGNPHLVLTDEDALLDLVTIASKYPDRNVELVTIGPGDDQLSMRVWERGVGETESCGTGACAAAAAARRWGLVGDKVTVHQHGGPLEVEFSGESMLLTGPAEHVFTADVGRP